MMHPGKSADQENRPEKSAAKLMVHGFVCPESSCVLSVEVQRGMPILSNDGQEAGKLAAVILDGATQIATHLLLSRLPETRGYWMVPVNFINEVRDGAVWLGISGQMVDKLPLWQSGN